jgi:hypothetical protein
MSIPALPRRARLLLLLSACILPAARADVEFVGVLITPQKSLFALSDTTSGRTDWLTVGKSFAGYEVTSFDPASDTLVLRAAGAEKRVRLKDDAKIKSARLEIVGTVTVGMGETTDVVRATLLFDQENTFPLQEGVTCRITPHRQPDGNILYRASFDRVLSDKSTARIAMPAIIALPGHPFSIKVGDLGFAFSPRPI